MYRTAELEQDLKRRNFEGFKLIKGIMAYFLTQEKNEVVRTIIMSYRRYTVPGESSLFYLQQPSISIRFPKVELILGTVMKKFNPKYKDSDTETIHALTHAVEKIDYEIFDIQISSTEAFDFVFDEVEEIVYKAGMPFFEKYQTLESVFQDAEQMPIDEMSRFIAQPLTLRRMIIKKLCNDPRYEEYAIDIIKYYKTESKHIDHNIVEALHAHLIENY